ncbi:hypothetical protein FACS189497_10230 [Betaproteobacteria bacterium]|nr:hypothetical protein FACS189497_10230 [Betaproteobacteria bacterium]
MGIATSMELGWGCIIPRQTSRYVGASAPHRKSVIPSVRLRLPVRDGVEFATKFAQSEKKSTHE